MVWQLLGSKQILFASTNLIFCFLLTKCMLVFPQAKFHCQFTRTAVIRPIRFLCYIQLALPHNHLGQLLFRDLFRTPLS